MFSIYDNYRVNVGSANCTAVLGETSARHSSSGDLVRVRLSSVTSLTVVGRDVSP